MKFIDEVKLYTKAGDGGNGCVSWRREKFIPMGGPAGGDGGNGGNVILTADDDVHSLLDFRFKPKLVAQSGQDGRSKNQYGKNGEDVTARVPVGTQVYDVDSDELIADLTENGQEATICKGGSGGFGNTRFTTATRQAPDFAKPGLPGEEKNLRLSLKLLADVGLLGFPNAGKSTLLSTLSAAKPKIADYPFTTLAPQLGVVQAKDGHSFVVADIPGLIEGASDGAGLGYRFLKHLERVRVLCHLLEPAPKYFANEEGSEDQVNEDDLLVNRYKAIRHELEKFSSDLSEVPEFVALSKMDITDESQTKSIKKLKTFLKKKKIPLLEISAATGENVEKLTMKLWNMVVKAKKEANTQS